MATRRLRKVRRGYHTRNSIPHFETLESQMLILGLILFLIGVFAHVPILTTIGVILLVIGAVLFILGSVGRPVAGRRHYW
jgi:uncharacterized membrane protein HdeD (DUF308 family)